MKTFLGILLMIAGAAFGVYVGLWICFIGGIIQIIEAIQATPIPAMDIALGVVRIIFAGFAGVLTGVVAIFPGYKLAGG